MLKPLKKTFFKTIKNNKKNNNKGSRVNGIEYTLWNTLFFGATFVVFLAFGLAVAFFVWLHQPLIFSHKPMVVTVKKYTVSPHKQHRSIGQQMVDAGIQTSPMLLQFWFRVSGKHSKIQAGNHMLQKKSKSGSTRNIEESNSTPLSLLDELLQPQNTSQTAKSITYTDNSKKTSSTTFKEGAVFAQLQQAIANNPDLKHDTSGWSGMDLIQKLNLNASSAEGQFFPDTYHHDVNSSDLVVWKAAAKLMERKRKQAHDAMDNGIKEHIKTEEELVILASLIEKETGDSEDAASIARVFINRLKAGTPLQTDPTVIYGDIQTRQKPHDGNWLRAKSDPNLWNTYIHKGLPPTAIAAPSWMSLQAAANPVYDGHPNANAFYFVAKGDGSGRSIFSKNLTQHNAAVANYIKNIKN